MPLHISLLTAFLFSTLFCWAAVQSKTLRHKNTCRNTYDTRPRPPQCFPLHHSTNLTNHQLFVRAVACSIISVDVFDPGNPINRLVLQCTHTTMQGSHFSGISLISRKSEVPFQGNSHSFSEKDMQVHPKILSKSLFFGSRLHQIDFQVKTISRGALVFREKRFWSLTPLNHEVKMCSLKCQARNMSKQVPDCTIVIVRFNTIPGGPPSFHGFLLFVTGTPDYVTRSDKRGTSLIRWGRCKLQARE